MASSSRCFDGELELMRDLEASGLNLLVPPSSLKKLTKILQKLERLLSKVDQDPSLDILEGLHPVMKALIAQKLLWHPNLDTRVFVISCLSEITRITAPNPPYDEEKMKEIFLVTRRALNNLYGASGKVVKKVISILHNFAKVRSCSLMLDLGCDEIIVKIFELFFGVIGSDFPRSAISDMETIMTLVIEESDEISSEILISLLNCVRKETRETMPRSWKLGESILIRCAAKLKPCLPKAVRSTCIPLREFSKLVSLICQGAVEDEPLVAKEMVVSDGLPQARKEKPSYNKLKKATVRSDKNAIKEEAVPNPTSHKRSRKPNSLMRPEEGYTLPSWSKGERKYKLSPSEVKTEESTSGEEEMEEPSAKGYKRPHYIKEYGDEQVGKKIRVWWSSEQTLSEGTISSFDPTSMTHTLLHDDGDEEILDLREERWERIETTTP